MFDMMKFDGESVKASELSGHTVYVDDIVGILSVRMGHNEDDEVIFTINEAEPTGKLLIYRANGEDCAMYIENSIETSCVADLL